MTKLQEFSKYLKETFPDFTKIQKKKTNYEVYFQSFALQVDASILENAPLDYLKTTVSQLYKKNSSIVHPEKARPLVINKNVIKTLSSDIIYTELADDLIIIYEVPVSATNLKCISKFDLQRFKMQKDFFHQLVLNQTKPSDFSVISMTTLVGEDSNNPLSLCKLLVPTKLPSQTLEMINALEDYWHNDMECNRIVLYPEILDKILKPTDYLILLSSCVIIIPKENKSYLKQIMSDIQLWSLRAFNEPCTSNHTYQYDSISKVLFNPNTKINSKDIYMSFTIER